MIFDSHCHVVPCGYKSNYNSLNIKQLLQNMKEFGIEKSVVMLNPFITDYICQKNHIVSYTNSNKKGKIICQVCGKIICECDTDPYRQINIALIEESKEHKGKLYPFIYLTTNSHIFQDEINFFEDYYHDSFYGFKFINTFNTASCSELENIITTKPLLFHMSNDKYSRPIEIIKATSHLTVPIILAHFCSFDMDALDFINSRDNYYTDLSPLLDLRRNYTERNIQKIFPIWINFSSLSFDDVLKNLFNSLNCEKILFGTDAPWGDTQAEINYFYSLGLDFSCTEWILSKNICSILNPN